MQATRMQAIQTHLVSANSLDSVGRNKLSSLLYHVYTQGDQRVAQVLGDVADKILRMLGHSLTVVLDVIDSDTEALQIITQYSARRVDCLTCSHAEEQEQD